MENRERLHNEDLSAEEEELFAFLLAEEGFASSPVPVVRPRQQNENLPLSFAQERLWFLDQWEPGSSAYNIYSALRMQGKLSIKILERSLSMLIQRHETLRTTFATMDGQPVQIIAPHRSASLPVIDLAGLSPDEQEAQTLRLAKEEARAPFDLSRGPLLRTTLLRLGMHEQVFLLTLHHIISDGWSMGIFNRELVTLYQELLQEQPATLPVLPIQYADYALWQRQHLQGAVWQEQVSYWTAQLAGVPPLLALPTDRPRPSVQTFAGAHYQAVVPAELARTLHALTQREGVTLFAVLLATLQTLLLRLSGQEDFCIGTYIAGRTRVEVEHLIGYFINNLALRADLAGDPTFQEALRRASQVSQEAFAHQELPFEQLLQELAIERTPRHTPLFQVMLVYQNMPWHSLSLPGLTISAVEVMNERANFDLSLWALQWADELFLTFEYNTDLFEASSIVQWAESFLILMQAAVRNPLLRLSQLPLLSTEQQRALVREMQGGARDTMAPTGLRTFASLVADQAARTPDTIALAYDELQLSYTELLTRAERLAAMLLAHGAGPEVAVGLLMEHSAEAILGLLSVLLAGAVAVPLDYTWPSSRLAFILRDTQMPLLLSQDTLLALLPPELLPRTCLCLERDWFSSMASFSLPFTHPAVDGRQLAYVIYTSGSTGQPKGVGVSQQALAHFTHSAGQLLAIAQGERVLQFASLSFDTCLEEIAPCLSQGGTLCLRTPDLLGEPQQFLRTCSLWGVSVLDLPTAYWHTLALALREEGASLPASLRLLIIGGELAQAEPLAVWRERIYQQEKAEGSADREIQLLNTYGPTEATVAATAHQVAAASAARPMEEAVIGRPLPHVQALVLDQHLQPVPPGIPGELYLGGEGLARGYLGQPALTAERFVPHPWSTEPGARLYRTGDMVRALADGELEFRGRRDGQVKIRGYRIEVGEIEVALSQHPAARACVVVVKEESGDRRLVAYVVPAQNWGELEKPEAQARLALELRRYLQERLPTYLLPGALILLEALPLTSRGKVDHAALPAPEQGAGAGIEEAEAPRTLIEEILTELWIQILPGKSSRVSRHDHFFRAGGHSLLATQLVARLRQVLGVELPLRAIFDTPTLAGLAQQIEQARRQQPLSIPPLQPHVHNGEAPLSYAQQRLWFLDQLLPDSAAYVVPLALQLTGRLDVMTLARCLQDLVQRHEALRTTIATRNGLSIQIIAADRQISLPMVELSALDRQVREIACEHLLRQEAQQPFLLERGPLMRTTLLRLEEERHILLLTLHHIITDAWSMGILLRELAVLYQALIQHRSSPLEPLTIQYADYAVWQRQWLERLGDSQGEEESSPLEQQLAFWRTQLAGAPALLELPTDHPRPQIQTFRGAHYSFVVEPELLAGLRQLSRQESTTLFMTLLTAFGVLLSRYSGQDDLVIGTPIANRTRAEVENVIGFFANTLALRCDLSGSPNVREMLKRVREVALGAYDRQDLPFERLVDALQPERDLSHTPLFQVMFALQTATVSRLEMTDIQVDLLAVENGLARFDLTLTMHENGDALQGVLEYNLDLFEPATIQRMAVHFQTLLAEMVAHPELALADLSLLTDAERRQLLVEWNATAIPLAHNRDLVALFEAQVERAPDTVALVLGEEQVTYGDVNRRANQLAHYLRELRVTAERCVGVCLERSPALVVGLLGTLKAGGAYVPLDPAYPAERLIFMLEDVQATALITTSALYQKLFQQALQERSGLAAGQCICLDSEHEWSMLAHQPTGNCINIVAPENLAYVIYTSGSTGRPKGVQVTQRGLCNLISWHQQVFALTAQDRATQVASPSFDAAGWEIWPYLATGATVVFVAEDVRQTPESLRNWLLEQQITRCFLPTPLAESVVGEEWPVGLKLQTLLTGGDWLRWAPKKELPFVFVNNYGPTENTVVATSGVIASNQDKEGPPPIGRPIANTRCYVLDAQLQPVPVGIIGELFLAGASLARGYLGQPAWTAERFIPDPFVGISHDQSESYGASVGTRFTASAPGGRLYRTGDMVRYLPDGRLEYHGRNDSQVKIRGYRIELGEIEMALCQHPQLREALVETWESRPGERRLVAYVVAASGQVPAPSDLRAFLSKRLPAYLLPAAFVPMESLPLTPNGKLDRRALPAPEVVRSETDESFTIPQTATERILADIWAEVLRLERVGIHENYFELGGDSILSMQIVAKALAAGLSLTPKNLFQYQTIAQLAAAISIDAPLFEADQEPVQGEMPLMPVQHWFFHLGLPEPQHWNQALLLQVQQPVRPTLLQQAVHALMMHHDALRLRAQRHADGWHLYHAAAPILREVPFLYIDLSSLEPQERFSTLSNLCDEIQASLDLEHGPLLRSVLFHFGSQQPVRLLLVIHHLAVDIVSWHILLDDLHTAFQQLMQGQLVHLPARTTSFKHWAEQLVSFAQTQALRQQASFWLDQPWYKVRPLPLEKSQSLEVNYEGSAQTIWVALSEQETQALLIEVPKAYHTQINEVLLTALVLTFAHWTGSATLLVHLEGHGREDLFDRLDLSRTVGWFTAMAPVVLFLSDNQGPGEALKHIKELLRRIPQNGIGFGLLRFLSQELTIREQLAALPLPEVSFNYGGRSVSIGDEGLFAPATESIGATYSKRGRRPHVLDIYSRISEGQLYIGWTYSENLHYRTTIEAIARHYLDALQALIQHCQSPEAGGYTPADFPDVELSQDELDAIVAKLPEL